MTRRRAHRPGLHRGRRALLTGGIAEPVRESARGLRALANDLQRRSRRVRHQQPARARSRSSASTSRAAATSPARTCWSASKAASSTCSATAGYSKLGLPGDMVPGVAETTATATAATATTPTRSSGLAFHCGQRVPARHARRVQHDGDRANINGAVIPARSENDTGNNPHNPLYGIQKPARTARC